MEELLELKENLTNRLCESIEKHGYTSVETVEISQTLDVVIVQIQKKMAYSHLSN